jgi:phospholipase/carboxylesterase
MSRIRRLLSIPKTKYIFPSNRLQSGLFCPSSPDATYSLFMPIHYEPGYAYPLIVWLHGSGSDESQLSLIMPLVSMRNYVGVAPRGVLMSNGAGADQAESYGWPQTYEKIPEVEQNIFSAIEAAAGRVNICRQRIFLAGFDSGGTMAFRIGLRYPQYFAGILSLCGSLPQGQMPFCNLTLARRLPIFMYVGRYSNQYPEAEVCANLRLLHAAGMLVTLRQYPCGQELALQMLGDMDRWIMEQIKSSGGVQASYDPINVD